MQLSLSYICDRPYNIYQSYEKLKPHYDMSVHMDFMDGHFVPRLGVHPEAVDELSYPSYIDIHAMITCNNPAWEAILQTRANVIFAHYESFHSEQQCVDFLTRDSRLKLAFKPYHTIQQIDTICDRLDVDEFLLMAYAPGIKVQDAYYNLDTLADTQRHVTVDGGVTIDTVRKFKDDRKVTLVVGSKVLFNENYEENLNCLIS
jgi:pentose-5-phosphate-3-epimerase